MNLQRFLDVSQATDKASLERELLRFAADIGFGLVNVNLIVAPPNSPAAVGVAGNVPEDWAEQSSTADRLARDPVLRLMRTASLPFTYDQQFYVDAGEADLWDEQAEFGYGAGVVIPMHLPGSKHFFLGMDRLEALPKDDQLTRLMADLQFLAVHSQQAAERLLVPAVKSKDPLPRLSRREVEILKWTLEGKSAGVIAQLLGLSEATVKYYSSNASKKLNSSSRNQAALTALRLGLIC